MIGDLDDSTRTFHNYASAARRVHSSVRTIQNWRRNGMTMGWRVGADGQRERVVREDVLLAWWRQTMRNSPVHQHRMRKIAREQGLTRPAHAERYAAL